MKLTHNSRKVYLKLTHACYVNLLDSNFDILFGFSSQAVLNLCVCVCVCTHTHTHTHTHIHTQILDNMYTIFAKVQELILWYEKAVCKEAAAVEVTELPAKMKVLTA